MWFWRVRFVSVGLGLDWNGERLIWFGLVLVWREGCQVLMALGLFIKSFFDGST